MARLVEYSGFKNHDGSRNWWIMFARAGGENLKVYNRERESARVQSTNQH